MISSVKRLIKLLIPDSQHHILRKSYVQIRYILFYSNFRRQVENFGTARYCPVCKSWLRSFDSWGIVPRPEARCPVCGCLERHRAAWLFFEKKSKLLDGSPKLLLDIAPMNQLENRFFTIRNLSYMTADLLSPDVMVRLDITEIPFSDNLFDIIYCSHVLEHVLDDEKAISELSRILKKDGFALIVVPITSAATIEDPSITSREERLIMFGQEDHVRRYGKDIKERLEENFVVDQLSENELGNPKDAVRYGLTGDKMFYCLKRVRNN